MITEKEIFAEKLKYVSEYAINFDERIIYIFGDLNLELGSNLRLKYDILKMWWDSVFEKEFSDITIDISSVGGDIYSINAALDFFHDLKQKNVVVNTRAQGVCMSAATVLLCGGTGVRMAYPNCCFLLHDMQIEGIGGTAQQIKNTANTISEEQLNFFSYYAKFANKDKVFKEKELEKEAKKWIKIYTKESFDYYLKSEKMLELKLIDKIL